MTRLAFSSLGAAALIAGIALIGSAPASSLSGSHRPNAARGVAAILPADGPAVLRGMTARGATSTLVLIPGLEDREQRSRGAASAL